MTFFNEFLGQEVQNRNLNKLYSRARLLAAQHDGVLGAHVRNAIKIFILFCGCKICGISTECRIINWTKTNCIGALSRQITISPNTYVRIFRDWVISQHQNDCQQTLSQNKLHYFHMIFRGKITTLIFQLAPIVSKFCYTLTHSPLPFRNIDDVKGICQYFKYSVLIRLFTLILNQMPRQNNRAY